MTGDDRLLALAEAVCDRHPIDLDSVLAATPPDDRRVLSLLAAISDQLWTPEPEDEPASLRRWGRFELRALLGRGAFGEVYRAWDPHFEREVAVKLRHANLDSEATHGLLLAEGRLLAKIDFPGVARVYELGEHDGRFGLVMERVEGETLAAAIARRGSFPASEVAAFGVELAGALAALHEANIVHRDLKAQNVILRPDGRLVLVDFGIGLDLSKPTDDDLVVSGTPLYMAPELFEGARPTPASDLYSLGVLLFQLLTGEFPVEAETVADLRAAHVSAPGPNVRQRLAGVPRGLVRVIEACLAGRAENRPAGAGRVGAALRSWTRERWFADQGRLAGLGLLFTLLLGLAETRALIALAEWFVGSDESVDIGPSYRSWLVDRQRTLDAIELRSAVRQAKDEYEKNSSLKNADHLAIRLSQAGAFQEALDLCEKASSTSAGSPPSLELDLPRNISLLGLGRTGEVRRALADVVEVGGRRNPSQEEVWLLASALAMEGNALAALNLLKNHLGDGETNFEQRGYLLALSLALELKDYGKVRQLLAQFRRLKPRYRFLADLRSAGRLAAVAGDRSTVIEITTTLASMEPARPILRTIRTKPRGSGLNTAAILEMAALLAGLDGEHSSALQLLAEGQGEWWTDLEMLLSRLFVADRSNHKELSCDTLVALVRERKAEFLWTGSPHEWKVLSDRLKTECPTKAEQGGTET